MYPANIFNLFQPEVQQKLPNLPTLSILEKHDSSFPESSNDTRIVLEENRFSTKKFPQIGIESSTMAVVFTVPCLQEHDYLSNFKVSVFQAMCIPKNSHISYILIVSQETTTQSIFIYVLMNLFSQMAIHDFSALQGDHIMKTKT